MRMATMMLSVGVVIIAMFILVNQVLSLNADIKLVAPDSPLLRGVLDIAPYLLLLIIIIPPLYAVLGIWRRL